MSATLEHIRSMDPLRASVSMAVGIVMDRVSRLGKEDQNDLFRLVKAMVLAKTEEEQEAIRVAMLEILEQSTGGVRAMPEPREGTADNLVKWKGHVAERVRQIRTEAQMTQNELAAKADLPQSHVSRIEKAHLAPSSKTIDKLAGALGVQPGEIDPSR